LKEKISTTVDGHRLPDALNEVSVVAEPGRTISFELSVDGELAMSSKGDGIIIATPTGSTAYARAAGGPILDSCLQAMTVVPVCSSIPAAFPLVVPLTSKLTLTPTHPKRRAVVIIDGMPSGEMKPSSKLCCERSMKPAKFFKWGDKGFYPKLRKKLRFFGSAPSG
jgi:NAD+ kinase